MIDLITDSRKIKEGDTFIALRGKDVDGHNYIEQAIKNSAKNIIAEHGNYEVETEIVEDTTKYLNEYIYNNYYNKIKDLKLIGVTGTSGKTPVQNYTAFNLYRACRQGRCRRKHGA